MNWSQPTLGTILEEPVSPASMTRGFVEEVLDDGTCKVRCRGDQVCCDLLRTSAEPWEPASGDQVLVWLEGDEQRGVILGRIGPSFAQRSQVTEVPDELVIEAKQGLTLKCGEGSITLRADGKVLIKGKDLVSHAQRTNRIKGGSVAIN